MGCFVSKELSQAEIEERRINKIIDQGIREQRKESDTKIKLLLLGTGDSGKSTFCKQMKVIHKDGFSSKEVMKFQAILRLNSLKNMRIIVQFMADEEGIDFGNDESKEAAQKILDTDIDTGLDDELAEAITILWDDENVVDTFNENCSELLLNSSCPYFFKNVQRFADNGFKPTNEDIFRAKLRTTGILETKFEVNGIEFTMVDVGGQRSERRKWLSCFDNVTAVIFLAALDEYDMVLQEDLKTNRLEESLRLFGEVTGSEFFQNTSFILFLNKEDLFQEKIKRKPFHKHFKDDDITRKQGRDYDFCAQFIEDKYELANSHGSKLYTFRTCAIDTDNCDRVFVSVRDMVISQALHMAGF
eukprot:TRINITY_DN2076_c0_g1_i1.p1 TRINITY_DN2076_c0_g1~~TRINITY_DN2076_c0_g1_i1.p1  ORF type:complete len:359 (-),score=86.35 TRINITY_DN2076_c0_g1_i1:66-1142(-)